MHRNRTRNPDKLLRRGLSGVVIGNVVGNFDQGQAVLKQRRGVLRIVIAVTVCVKDIILIKGDVIVIDEPQHIFGFGLRIVAQVDIY